MLTWSLSAINVVPRARRHSAAVVTAGFRSFSDAADGAKIKQPKVKRKDKKSKNADDDGTGKDRLTDIMVKSYDAPYRKAPRGSDEEMARRAEIGRNYVIGRFNQHNELEHDLAVKIRMKRRAIKFLPKDGIWKAEALKIDDFTGPPEWRHIPAWTPPIPGFNPTEYIEREEE